MAASFLEVMMRRSDDMATTSQRIRLDDLPSELLQAVMSHCDSKGLCSPAATNACLHRALAPVVDELAASAVEAELHALLGGAYDTASWCKPASRCVTYSDGSGNPCQCREGGKSLYIDVEHLIYNGGTRQRVWRPGHLCWVRRVEFVTTEATRRDGVQVLCYMLERAYGGNDIDGCQWVLVKWPCRCVTSERFVASITDEIRVAAPTDRQLDKLHDWQRREQAASLAGHWARPSLRTSWDDVSVDVDDDVVEVWHCSQQVWQNRLSGHDPSTWDEAVTVGEIGDRTDLLAKGSSTCDGDQREEPWLTVYHLPALLREHVPVVFHASLGLTESRVRGESVQN